MNFTEFCVCRIDLFVVFGGRLRRSMTAQEPMNGCEMEIGKYLECACTVSLKKKNMSLSGVPSEGTVWLLVVTIITMMVTEWCGRSYGIVVIIIKKRRRRRGLDYERVKLCMVWI